MYLNVLTNVLFLINKLQNYLFVSFNIDFLLFSLFFLSFFFSKLSFRIDISLSGDLFSFSILDKDSWKFKPILAHWSSNGLILFVELSWFASFECTFGVDGDIPVL